MIALFLFATLLPYVAAAWALAGWRREAVPADRARFEVVVVGTGVLYTILNLLAFTGTMSVPAVAACGIAAVVGAWWFVSKRGATGAASIADVRTAATRWWQRPWPDRASTLLVAVVCGLWLTQAAAGLEVGGTDADHYHIPHAVNFALGAGPMGLRATPHTYPMGTSVLFGWFILPFSDAFVIEGGTLLWYLVLVVSVAALFRSLTGLSGWAWSPWFVLCLSSMPLMQGAWYPSSDLSYAGAFLAVTAQLTWMVERRAGTARDWVVLGLALGLLAGCKTTGTYSAVMLAGAAAFAYLLVCRPIPWRLPRAWLVPLGIALAACLCAGGIWLVRSTVLFGKPIEIVTDRYYGSMLGDLRDKYGGDWGYLLWRTKLKIVRWLGPEFLALGLATLWLGIESVVLLARRRADNLARVRAWFLASMTAVAAVHAVGLLGAPWTSLEYTGGLSLRYALPLWMLYAFLAYVAIFSRWLRWHEHPVANWAAWGAMAAASVWSVAAIPGLGTLTPNPTAGPVVSALVVAGVLAVFWAVLRDPLADAQATGLRRAGPFAAVAVLACAAMMGSTWLEARHTVLRAEADAHDEAEYTAWTNGTPPAVDPEYRIVFLQAHADELKAGEQCRERRFFVVSRFDAPLALQSGRFTSVVYESRWDTTRVLEMLRRGGGAGVCDYVVVNREDAERRAVTQLGASFLRPITSAGMYLLYRAR